MKRVLIADDLGDQRALDAASLALAGFAVEEAADGGQVIDIVTDHRPDVIVLDLTMPVLDGLEVCRRLKANDRTAAIPIIILTGNTLPGVRETVKRAGAVAFLARPCAPEILVAAVRHHTGEAALPGEHRGDVSGWVPRREIDVSTLAAADDVLVGPAAPGTRLRRPRRMPWLYTIAAAVVLAIGITLGLGPLTSMQRGSRLNEIAEASVDQHQKLLRGLLPPAIAGASPRAVEDWFRQRVDFKVVLRDRRDPRVTLMGARMSRLADADTAAIDYQLDQDRISLFVIPEDAYNQLALSESPRFKHIRRRGYDVIIWRHGSTGYTMVSEIGVRACQLCHSPDEKLDGASLESFVVRQ